MAVIRLTQTILWVVAWAGASLAQAQNAFPSRHPQILAVRAILAVPEREIDFAKAKVSIDKLVDPRIDVETTLRQIDNMAAEVRAMLPLRATSEQRMLALRAYLYDAGPWNNGQPFSYDFADPMGTHVPNKLLANYLRSKKGNCVSMPFLHIALAQRLGLTAAASTAPRHVFMKLQDDLGVWHNIEPVSGGWPRRDASYHRDSPMTAEAIASGIYMRPLGKKETVVVMANVLAEHYGSKQVARPDLAIAVADVMLEYDPRNVNAMRHKGRAYLVLLQQRFGDKYATPKEIPEGERHQWEAWSKQHRLWFEKAEALGWREPPKGYEARYLEMVKNAANSNR